MANKRVTELAPISSTDLRGDDQMLVSDVSAKESKRLTILDLAKYIGVVTSSFTGSFNGTASWARQSLTASYVQGANVQGTVTSASYALSSSYSLFATSASYAANAGSSSISNYALNAGTASYAYTASIYSATVATHAVTADSASYLVFTPGFNNGTASYSMLANVSLATTASLTSISSSYSLSSFSASYLLYTGVANGTASYSLRGNYADVSGIAAMASSATSSITAQTASYLYYTGSQPNGTASYAITASYSITASYAVTASCLLGFNTSGAFYSEGGPYNGTVNSSGGQEYIDFGSLIIDPSDGLSKRTVLEVWGDIYTSTGKNQYLTLKLENGATVTTLDTDFFVNQSGSKTTNEFYFKSSHNLLGNWNVRLYCVEGDGTFSYTSASRSNRTVKLYVRTLSDSWSVVES